MSYQKTQWGPWGFLLVVFGALQIGVGGGQMIDVDPFGGILLMSVGTMLVFMAAVFTTLTIRGESSHLTVSFGPLPMVSFRVNLDQIRSVARERSRWFDGWGIHWTVGRGWIYNLWGYDCVRINLESRSFRVGTADPEGLMSWLQSQGISPHDVAYSEKNAS